MVDYQDSKTLVLQFYEELEAASVDEVAKVMNRYMSSDYQFRGVHPFNELEGADAVAEALWKPLLGAFTQIQRRQDIFMAGTNEIDGTEWVTSMGNFMGLFDHDWLGIPSTGKIAFLPYVEFNGFLNQHEGPFRKGLDNIVFNGHVCRFAEGHYAGWFGWPNLTMNPAGGLMGLPASTKNVDMRVVDMYRRDGDKLVENWIFIDILHFLMQQGVDVLERTRRIVRH
jgi:hypothetical protein